MVICLCNFTALRVIAHKIKAEAEKLGQKVTKKHNIKAYGSIRLSVPDAQWIEENIPAKTRVVIDSQDDKRDAWEYLKVD